MNHLRSMIVLSAGLALLGAWTPALISQEGAREATIRVLVPADAVIEIDGVKTRQTGTVRRYLTPVLQPGKRYFYVIKATWTENGQPVVREEKIQVTPGAETELDFRAGAAAKKPDEKKDDPIVKKPDEVKPKVRPSLDVPFVPTPQEVVDKMLELAGVTKDDLVYDLGCGDGRIVVTAAKKFGARGVGVDLDPERVKDSLKNVKDNMVEDKVAIREGSVFDVDVSPASVVTLYLFPEVNLKLRPKLQKLKPGSRIVSHAFDMGDWEPDKKISFEGRTLYLWTIPDAAKAKKNRDPESPYVPTAQEVVDKMLEVVKVTKDDVVYDLGCGDGRIVVTAAKKYGAKGVGVDIDPQRVKESLENIKKNKVEDKVEIREADVMEVMDLGKATVLALYLLPDHIKKLEPNLKKQLKPGTRVIAHDFAVEGWQPDAEIPFKTEREHTLYLYTIKADKEQSKEEKKLRDPDVIFVPTPQDVVEKMLEMAKVTKDDLVYDLGCGDGRIPVTAARKFGARAIGFDIDPQRIKESNANVAKHNVGDKVTIKHADIFKEDLSQASVITLYLLPRLNVKLLPQFEKLKPGTRIVSHDFNIEGIKPDDMVRLRAKDDDGNEDEHIIYLWTVPLKKE